MNKSAAYWAGFEAGLIKCGALGTLPTGQTPAQASSHDSIDKIMNYWRSLSPGQQGAIQGGVMGAGPAIGRGVMAAGRGIKKTVGDVREAGGVGPWVGNKLPWLRDLVNSGSNKSRGSNDTDVARGMSAGGFRQ